MRHAHMFDPLRHELNVQDSAYTLSRKAELTDEDLDRIIEGCEIMKQAVLIEKNRRDTL